MGSSGVGDFTLEGSIAISEKYGNGRARFICCGEIKLSVAIDICSGDSPWCWGQIHNHEIETGGRKSARAITQLNSDIGATIATIVTGQSEVKISVAIEIAHRDSMDAKG